MRPWPTPRGRRGRPAVRGLPRLSRRRAARVNPTSGTSPARSPARSWPPCLRLRPDFAIIHAQRANRQGDVLIEGILGVQKEAVLGAGALGRHGRGDRGGARPRSAPTPCILPSWTVGRSRWSPGGAYPSYAQATTRATTPSTRHGTAIARERESFLAWMDEHVFRSGPKPSPVMRAQGCMRSAMTMPPTTPPTEIMTVGPRARSHDDVCFVGIGAPSAACNLARLTHAPGIVLIYESGTIGTRPRSCRCRSATASCARRR